MPIRTPPAGTASTTEIPDGLITGHLLRLARESVGLTQETAAAACRVDVNTWRSWETGRRSLANTKVGHLRALLRRLRSLGTSPVLLHHLEVAIEADLFIAHVLIEGGRGDPADHMLAGWVSTRAWNDLLAWTLAGTPPRALAGIAVPTQRGPAPDRPDLPRLARTRFFDSLRTTAERAATDRSPSAVLLRRQAYFMVSWDPAGGDWLARMERAELRQLRAGAGSWTPAWVAGRSLAVARACQGDRDQLRRFIATHLADDLCEAANLNYWAYWSGEEPGPATSDEFMASDLGTWRGSALLRHLTDGLRDTNPYVELSIHSVWALLGRRPYLLSDDPVLTSDLRQRVAALLDDGTDLSPAARRELDQIYFLTAAKGPR